MYYIDNHIAVMMKANSIENLIADQIFKITKADENICDYLEDCESPFNLKNEVL